jgi:hypothetical protein
VDYAQIVYGPYFVRYHTDPEFMAKVKALEAKVQKMRKLAAKI